MKTYKHLYESMMERRSIEFNIKDASDHKRSRHNVKAVLSNPGPVVDEIITSIENHTWCPPNHGVVQLQEGAHKKIRDICKPQFNNEQIVHHMLINELRSIFMKTYYEFSCGSVPGRGPTLAKDTLRRWVREYKDQPLYIAELDIKKFYQHVDIDILKQMLQRIIKDDRFLEVLFKVLDCCSPGLPLGFYTSPWLGNFYLTPLDRYILHELHPTRYLRYVDNIYLIDIDKEHLHQVVKSIMEFCREKLHVEIKNDWQVFRFEYQDKDGRIRGRAINCLGFVIHYNRVTLRKSLLKRIRAKARRVHRNKVIRVRDAAALVSYSGWLQQTDTYDYYRYYIKPCVSFAYCKRFISKNMKRSNQHDKLENCSQQCDRQASRA